MDARLALDPVEEHAVRFLNALGAAWITYQLYPNPAQQEPFLRAVTVVNDEAGSPPIGVGPGIFVIEDEEYAPEREGVEKLARQLFLHDAEQVLSVGGATPEGLAALLGIVAQDDDDVRAQGGIAMVLSGVENSGLVIRQRGLLHVGTADGKASADVPEAEEDLAEVEGAAGVAFAGASPDEIAAAVMAMAEEQRAEDPVAIDAYIDGYHTLHEEIAVAIEGTEEATQLRVQVPSDDPYKTVRSFIEAFFHLPRWVQISVLERVLDDIERPSHQMFLDQFSGHDLTDLLRDLSSDASQALMHYAVEASAEPGGHPLDLLAGLTAETEVEAARKAVADRVSSLLRETGDGVLADDLPVLRSEMEEPFQDERLEASTFYGLFECEHRRDRLQRLVRVWTGRVARYIRDDDLVNAERLLNSVLENDPYPDEHAETVGKAIERMATPDLLRLLADRNGDEQSAAAEALLTAFGMHVIDQLVTQLAGEDDSRVRRSLTNMLAGAARTKPRALEPYLSDHRWFLVRNLTTALGKTANPDAMGSLRMVLTHSDHRVRTEALRSTVRLMRGSSTPVLVRALSDSHEQVRHTAATLVRGATDDEADRALADELRADRLPADMSIEVISILSERGSASGALVLEELASRRFAVRAHARAKRRAAREALKGGAQ
jgi:hypothetical protein